MSLTTCQADAFTKELEMTAEPRRWFMFMILLVGAFLPPLDFFIVNVALPSMRVELGATPSAEQFVISAYASLYAVTLTTGGRLGDLYGRGRIFFVGLIGFACASALCGFAWSPSSLIVGRALQGVTAALMAPQALASIQAIFPEAEKGRALSLYGAVFGLAAVIGQALGGVLITLDLLGLGWRTIFLVNLPVAVAVVAFGIPVLKETRARHARKPDLGGMVLSVMTLGAVIIPLIEGRESGWPLWSWVSLGAVPVLAYLFWRFEAQVAHRGGAPLIDPAALQAPGLSRALLIALLLYSVGAFFLLFSVYLQGALNVSALSAGLVFLPFGVGYLIGPLSISGCKRIFGSYVNPVGMGLQAVGILGLACLILATPAGVYPLPMLVAVHLFLMGFGLGLALPTLMQIVTGRVAPAISGMIAGVASSTLQISTALSVAIIGGIFYTLVGAQTDASSITYAFIISLLCIALCQAAGAVVGVTLVRRSGIR